MGSTPTDRRRFLQYVGTGALLGLAGCTGTALQSAPDATGTTTAEQTDGATETTTETDTPTMSTVFHLATGTEAEQEHALRNVENLLGDDTVDTDTVEVVANAQGITAFIASTPVKEQVEGLLDQDVQIKICRNSMAAFDLEESDFLDGVDYVESGVGELTVRQAADGWAYIRVP